MTSRLLYAAAVALIVAARTTAAAAAQDDQTAEQVYKNIQVLKGVPASTFMNTMFFQRYALGVSCSYCHVDSNWASDDKPTKRRARDMLRMVLELNQKQFDGVPAVNCMTCHRGSVSPAREIPARRRTVDEMLAGAPAGGALPARVPVVIDEVLSRYLAALGGATALAKVQTRVIAGQMITAEGSIVAFEDSYAAAPARFLSVRHFGGSLGDFATGFDGSTGWHSDNRGVTVQRGGQRAELAMTAALAIGGGFRSLYRRLQVDSVAASNSPGDVVLSAVSVLTGRTERLYFDRVTGLLRRRSIETESLFGPFTTDLYFENYQAFDGVMLPTMVSEFTPDFGTVRNITTVKHNVSLGPDLFATPAVKPSP